MTKNLIAKPIIKDQFWIVTDGKEKVGNVLAAGSGYEVKLNGNKTHYKNTDLIKRQTNIEFERVEKSTKKDIPFNEYPTPNKIYNSVYDLKRKLHLFTKAKKSKCYYAAGYFIIEQGDGKTVAFCPKYIFVQRYKYVGPFKTSVEAENVINIQ